MVLLAGVEVGEEVEDLELVGEIEERRRLVEQHQWRALGKGEGDPGRCRCPPDNSSTSRSASSVIAVSSRASSTAAASAGTTAGTIVGEDGGPGRRDRRR